ncbi:protein of unknown function (DUF1992) domain containing protein [Rhypophila decipiens]
MSSISDSKGLRASVDGMGGSSSASTFLADRVWEGAAWERRMEFENMKAVIRLVKCILVGSWKTAKSAPDAPEDENAPSSQPSQPQPPDPDDEPSAERLKGAMSRRLQEATEDALLTGGRAGQRAIEDAGFSEELKTKLLSKIADAKFQDENASAFAEAGLTSSSSSLPSSAGHGTRSIASSQAWTGEENPEDTVLRMLDDARKPLPLSLRSKPKIPTPNPIDMRLKKNPTVSPGHRISSAREKAQAYASQEVGLTPEEREELRREFRERFNPNARAVMPNTISGLAALANERIENAIARGQFKNIPRGKGVERDTRADNPFIDTTEYILNKMIKRQEMAPPWIEKQQELVKAVKLFRSRLRADWGRHAARMIASKGGSLEEQMRRAREYAKAEEIHNPRRKNVEGIAVPSNVTDDVVMLRLRQEEQEQQKEKEEDAKDDGIVPAARPFRDADWEAHERSYMELAVTNINAITRSYNLMAPELAKKPYFSLERELNACFADVAPLLAETIRQRALGSKPVGGFMSGQVTGVKSGASGVLDRFGGQKVPVYESTAPRYGMKEFWRDLWGGGEKKG